jgi:hypothetical protein
MVPGALKSTGMPLKFVETLSLQSGGHEPVLLTRTSRQIADGRDQVLAEAAGITADSWHASPATHVGHELIAAGMLILAGGGNGVPLDYTELERWMRVGFERGTRSRHGER